MDTKTSTEFPTFRVRTRTTCRSCGASTMFPILSLGDQCVSDFLSSAEERPRAPLSLVLCDPQAGGCGLLQLRDTVEAEFLYRNYWYRSGVNRTMREALADIARSAGQLVELSASDTVIDIGSNDGTLLRSYPATGLTRVGFEPATNLMPHAQDRGTVVVNDFFGYEPFRRLFGSARAKVVTSIAMFYDLEDPNAFVRDVGRVLHPEGVWIVQMSYLPLMLQQNAFDNICHEHLEYYALGSLATLLERHGLRIIDAELNDVNGGSFRVYVAHEGAAVRPLPGAPDRLQELREAERAWHLPDIRTYQAFAERVEDIKRRLLGFLESETARGKTVYVYGASTKGNTLLQYFGLGTSLIRAAAERNPDKWGKKTVGTFIPIVSEEEARAARPAYFLVLPWHFLSEFVERERAFLEAGGKFIVPLPEFVVLGREALAERQPAATMRELLLAPAAASKIGFSRGEKETPA